MPTGEFADAVQIGEWVVNPALDTISRGTETQKLEPKTMQLLMCLANSAGNVVSVDRLLTEVWSGVIVGSASVYQAISQLRRLLGDVDAEPTYIATIPRKGYRLIAPVRRVVSSNVGGDGKNAAIGLVAADTGMARGGESATVDGAGSSGIAGSPAEKGVAASVAASVGAGIGSGHAAGDGAADGAGAAMSASLPQASERAQQQATAASPSRRVTPFVLGVAALVALLAIGFAVWQRSRWPSAESNASIVVLPFVDMTAGKTDQSFCDGLTEELSNWLAQIPTLRVVARTSAFAFRGQGEDVRKIGKALDTNHILEGSMRRDGDHMRVTVQLIDARNGYHLWSEEFDRPLDDVIKVQEDISRSVAQVLKVRLTTDSERQFAARRTADPEAYQLYLLARHNDQLVAPEPTERAIDLYRQVLKADPKFALAYVGLARAYLNQGYFQELPTADVAARVEPLLASALSADDRLSAAYAVRGALRADQSRISDALEDLHRAISIDPSEMSAFAEMGRIWLRDGQPREALKNYDRAAELDPLNSTLQSQRCTVFADLADYEKASEACERARVLQPASAAAAVRLSWLAEARGLVDEALRWNAVALKYEPTNDFDQYWTRATLFLSVGLTAQARAAVEAGRKATQVEDGADAALVRVVYCEGGEDALRRYLDSVNLDRLPYAAGLLEAAYGRLLLRDPTAAKELIARSLEAADREPGYADIPWYARGERVVGVSYRLDLAVAEIALGDRAAADRELDNVLAMVNRMIAAGVQRHATFVLRAKVYALKGRGDDAMRDLGNAAELGWRSVWWAEHEPYLASLRARQDFQALMARISQSNDQLIKRIKADSPG